MAKHTSLLENLKSKLIYCPQHVDMEKIGWKEADKIFKKNWKQLVKCDKKAREKNSLVGRVFGVPVGDGAAYYQVAEETLSKVFIQHIKHIGDDWADRYYGYGGTFPRKEILLRLSLTGLSHQ